MQLQFELEFEHIHLRMLRWTEQGKQYGIIIFIGSVVIENNIFLYAVCSILQTVLPAFALTASADAAGKTAR
jgi:hypothetical protein